MVMNYYYCYAHYARDDRNLGSQHSIDIYIVLFFFPFYIEFFFVINT